MFGRAAVFLCDMSEAPPAQLKLFFCKKAKIMLLANSGLIFVQLLRLLYIFGTFHFHPYFEKFHRPSQIFHVPFADCTSSGLLVSSFGV